MELVSRALHVPTLPDAIFASILATLADAAQQGGDLPDGGDDISVAQMATLLSYLVLPTVMLCFFFLFFFPFGIFAASVNVLFLFFSCSSSCSCLDSNVKLLALKRPASRPVVSQFSRLCTAHPDGSLEVLVPLLAVTPARSLLTAALTAMPPGSLGQFLRCPCCPC